jgi:hypothetical protein
MGNEKQAAALACIPAVGEPNRVPVGHLDDAPQQLVALKESTG